MKQKLCVLIIFGALCSRINAQVGITPENFYDIKARMNTYYDSIRQIIGDSALAEDESGYGQYQLWLQYWEPLVYPSGNFMVPYTAMNKLTENYLSGIRSTSTAISNWTELGPFDQPGGTASGNGVGVVHFIVHRDPINHPEKIITGSSLGGGLWYSNDAGDNWYNAGTDQLPN